MGKQLIIGSFNKTKVNAVKAVFQTEYIKSVDIASGVSKQPISNEMTRLGAMNRAKFGLEENEADYSIGLEGGVTFLDERLYLCNWGALVTATGKTYTASGGLIPLPAFFVEPILQGEELSTLMNKLTNEENVRSTEGAIGVFTNGLIKREQLYIYIVTLLKGQLLYEKNY